MSAHNPRHKNTIWHTEITTAKAARAPVAAKLVSFAQHKTTLLGNLRKMYERVPRSESFNEDESWRSLTRVAEEYFWGLVRKKESMPIANRIKRLKQLAKASSQARNLVDKATRDDVGHDLFKAWCAEAGITAASLIQNKNFSVVNGVVDEIAKVVTTLATVERAASRAAADLYAGRGRPKGTVVLPRKYIYALAKVYRRSTGLKPGAGRGPFARFTYAFLTAVGQRVLDYDSVVDMIKDARSSEKGPSVFN